MLGKLSKLGFNLGFTTNFLVGNPILKGENAIFHLIKTRFNQLSTKQGQIYIAWFCTNVCWWSPKWNSISIGDFFLCVFVTKKRQIFHCLQGSSPTWRLAISNWSLKWLLTPSTFNVELSIFFILGMFIQIFNFF